MAAENQETDTVGETLRRARLAKKLELQDVAAYLCIRARFLEALENGNTKDLPGDAYAQGFVRSYAAYLGLDADKTVSEYKREMSGKTAEAEADAERIEESESETLTPKPAALIVSATVLIAIFCVWKAFHANDPVVVVAAPESEAVTVLDESYPLPEQTAEPAVKTVVEAPVPPVPPKKPQVPAAAEEQADGNAVVSTPEVAESTIPAQRAPVEEAVENIHIYGQRNVNPRLVLVANEASWIEVRRGENILISRVLNKGDRYQVSRNSENLFLKTGNAGGLDVFLDGELMPPVGPKGALRANVPLNPDNFIQEEAAELDE